MNVSSTYYNSAAFRVGVEFLVGDTRAVFRYDSISFEVELNPAAAAYVEILCRDLNDESGLVISAVAKEYGAFTPHVWEVLGALDKYGFLTEKDRHMAVVPLTGWQFWQQVEAFSFRTKQRYRPILYDALTRKNISRGALIRYAQEYYHLVKQGPTIIAGMLAHVGSARTKSMLTKFLIQEVGHERLLLQSLAAAGLSESEVTASIPLPETFSVVASLQTLADQDPLSFKAVAFLLEQASAEFHLALRDACEHVGLNEGFWSPIVRHAEINDDGDHGNISADLLSEVQSVDSEQRVVALVHVASLIESLVDLEHAVLNSANELTPIAAS